MAERMAMFGGGSQMNGGLLGLLQSILGPKPSGGPWNGFPTSIPSLNPTPISGHSPDQSGTPVGNAPFGMLGMQAGIAGRAGINTGNNLQSQEEKAFQDYLNSLQVDPASAPMTMFGNGNPRLGIGLLIADALSRGKASQGFMQGRSQYVNQQNQLLAQRDRQKALQNDVTTKRAQAQLQRAMGKNAEFKSANEAALKHRRSLEDDEIRQRGMMDRAIFGATGKTVAQHVDIVKSDKNGPLRAASMSALRSIDPEKFPYTDKQIIAANKPDAVVQSVIDKNKALTGKIGADTDGRLTKNEIDKLTLKYLPETHRKKMANFDSMITARSNADVNAKARIAKGTGSLNDVRSIKLHNDLLGQKRNMIEDAMKQIATYDNATKKWIPTDMMDIVPYKAYQQQLDDLDAQIKTNIDAMLAGVNQNSPNAPDPTGDTRVVGTTGKTRSQVYADAKVALASGVPKATVNKKLAALGVAPIK